MKFKTVLMLLLVVIALITGLFLYFRVQASLLKQIDEATNTYKSISSDEAKAIFAQNSGDYLIVDVRRSDEYASGHIPGAINFANEDILDEPPVLLPDKNQTIYIYCRSGSRSKQASDKLARMGYTNIIEFGGIIDWNGEVVTGE